ncbi:MAG: hypothetical protein E7536_04405 [Ruminococcaceae bacterium]|nr:hypothetical protein [Oscillospiraceae bacterium]
MGLFDLFKTNNKAKTNISENKTQNNVNENQVIFENRAISADPPYVILKLDGAYYIQLFDLMCRRFFDITNCMSENYAIALFRLRENELSWIQNDTGKLDQLAKRLFDQIPRDRFVKASLITPDGQMLPLSVTPHCDSIDQPVMEAMLQLNIVEDILSDAQKEKYIFSSIRSGVSLTKDDVKDLSLRELLSVVFVTRACSVDGYPEYIQEVKRANSGFVLCMVADWLKHNPFYIITDYKDNPIKMQDHGIPFTCVYSSRELAEETINGVPMLKTVVVDSNKPDFWKKLMSKGFVQICADNSPVTLTVEGCLIYSMAATPE